MRSVWNQIECVIRQKQYTDADLRAILRGWRNLLGDCFTIPNERQMILQVVNSTLQKLEVKTKEEGEGTLLGTLRCMLHNEYFDARALNQFLMDSSIPYHYVLNEDALIKEGVFKMGNEDQQKFDCLFISHSCEDRKISDAFVEFMESIGLPTNQIFYSSMPEHGVSLGENIVDTIKNRLFGKKVHVIFMLSQNYYTSVMCLNEMGAAWILQHTYTSILLPGYEYRNIKGAIDAGKVGIKLDGDPAELRARLIQLRNQIQKEFRLPPMDEITWNRKLDYFMNCIKASDSVFAAP